MKQNNDDFSTICLIILLFLHPTHFFLTICCQPRFPRLLKSEKNFLEIKTNFQESEITFREVSIHCFGIFEEFFSSSVILWRHAQHFRLRTATRFFLVIQQRLAKNAHRRKGLSWNKKKMWSH